MSGRMLGAVVALALCAGAWWAVDNLTLLRGTALWDYRYLVLLVGIFGVLSVAERIAGFLDTWR